jgi:ATP-binding cassette subfamily C protein
MTAAPAPLSLLQFARSIVSELRWRVPLAAAVTLGIAFTEGAGLLLLLPLLDAVGVEVDRGGTGALSGQLRGAFTQVGLEPSLAIVLCSFIAITALHALLYAASLSLNPRLEQLYALALRRRLYAAVIEARWSHVGTRRITDVLHALTVEADRVATAVSHLLMVATSLMVTAVYVAIALRLSVGLTVLVGAFGALLLYSVRGRTQQSAQMGETYVEATRRQFQVASDSLYGLKVLKSLAAEERAIAGFSETAAARVRSYFRLLEGFARSKVALDIGAATLMSLVLYVAVTYLEITGATLVLLIVIFSRIMPRVTGLQAAAQTVAANFASVGVIIRMTADCAAHRELPPSPDAPPIRLRDRITFDRVSLTYPDGTVALRDVDLEIPAGRLTAIVGASGAGKSTLADLLLGLLTPQDGRILVDGEPLTESAIGAWRRNIGYVPQGAFLLPDTVRANLHWAKPEASEADLWMALERAHAADIVRTRPAGLDTPAGEVGTLFSGGERQRLTLARALLLHPSLLVLDEATSALDLASERLVLDAVEDLGPSVTRVIITHRLSAIRNADVIHVLDRGRVVESGTWDQLTMRGGIFAALLASQDCERPELRTAAV